MSHLLGRRSSSGFFGIHANSNSQNGASLEFYSDAHGSRPGELTLIATGAEKSNGGVMKFLRHHQNDNKWYESMRIDRSGQVGIGTTALNDPDYRLYVQDGIKTGRVKTDATLADYVFQPGHRLTPLSEVEQFVWQHHHLPGVISQAEVDEAGGVELTAFTVQLQEKLEELYLHTIALEKRVLELEAELAEKSESSEEAEASEGAQTTETPSQE